MDYTHAMQGWALYHPSQYAWRGLAGRASAVEEEYAKVLAEYGEELTRLFAWQSQRTRFDVPTIARTWGPEAKAHQQVSHASPAEIARLLKWGEYPY